MLAHLGLGLSQLFTCACLCCSQCVTFSHQHRLASRLLCCIPRCICLGLRIVNGKATRDGPSAFGSLKVAANTSVSLPADIHLHPSSTRGRIHSHCAKATQAQALIRTTAHVQGQRHQNRLHKPKSVIQSAILICLPLLTCNARACSSAAARSAARCASVSTRFTVMAACSSASLRSRRSASTCGCRFGCNRRTQIYMQFILYDIKVLVYKN